MKAHLDTGMTFAKARQTAVSELFGDEVADMLGSPNDSLAVEYVRQLVRIKSKVAPFAVQRTGAMHDTPGAVGRSPRLLSACVMRTGSVEAAADFVPKAVADVLRRAVWDHDAPVDEGKLGTLMLGVLRRLSQQDFSRLPDLSEGLENRIYNGRPSGRFGRRGLRARQEQALHGGAHPGVVMAAFLGLDGALGALPAPNIPRAGLSRAAGSCFRACARRRRSRLDSLAYLRRLSDSAAAFVDAESRATTCICWGFPRAPLGLDFTADSVRMS
jgi:hypothetical protein